MTPIITTHTAHSLKKSIKVFKLNLTSRKIHEKKKMKIFIFLLFPLFICLFHIYELIIAASKPLKEQRKKSFLCYWNKNIYHVMPVIYTQREKIAKTTSEKQCKKWTKIFINWDAIYERIMDLLYTYSINSWYSALFSL